MTNPNTAKTPPSVIPSMPINPGSIYYLKTVMNNFLKDDSNS